MVKHPIYHGHTKHIEIYDSQVLVALEKHLTIRRFSFDHGIYTTRQLFEKRAVVGNLARLIIIHFIIFKFT